MLVTITNQCQMGCTHCMQDAQPIGQHMSLEVFKKSLTFIERFYQIIMISGGEPTEHPLIFDFLNLVNSDWYVILMSNGLFLKDKEMKDRILSYENLNIQIYNDPAYYPIRVENPRHPRIVYGDKINLLSPFGRAVKNKISSERQYPCCFNLRSIIRSTQDFSKTINTLRLIGKMCTPSIGVNGEIYAGEAPTCYQIGSVDSSNKDLLLNTARMGSCNRCGLEIKLEPAYKKAIGI